MGRKTAGSRLRRNIIDFTKNFLIISIIFAGSTITVSGLWNNDGSPNSIFENTIFAVSEQENSGIIENTELPELKRVQNQTINQTANTDTTSPETPVADSGAENTSDTDSSGGSGGGQSSSGPKLKYTSYVIYDINEVPNESQFLRDIGAYAEGYSITSNYNNINKNNVGVYNITISASNENGTTTGSVKISITDENTEIFYGN